MQRELSGLEHYAQRDDVARSEKTSARTAIGSRFSPHRKEKEKGANMLGTILIVILVLALLERYRGGRIVEAGAMPRPEV
jgi:hypothetical protein